MKFGVPIVVALLMVIAGCDDGKPIVLTSSRLPSPDGQSVAIVESVDNGLGFGQGMLYDEVHVGPMDLRTVGHFDFDAYVVFYAARESITASAPTVSWVDANHVRIAYDASQSPTRPFDRIGRIRVEYVAQSSP
jgi:hypothetical protein